MGRLFATLRRLRSLARSRPGVYVTQKCTGYDNSGLGNKMLCIATAYAYSKRYNTPLNIEEPENWGINAATFESHFKEAELAKDLGLPLSIPELFPRIHFRPAHELYGRYSHVHTELKHNDYIPIPNKRSLLISGYFCRSEYFVDAKPDILALFSPNASVQSYLENKYSNQIRTGFNAMHIRLGDYVRLGMAAPLTYYVKASLLIKNRLPWLIFSDDLAAASQVADLLRTEGLNASIAEHEPSYVHLFLMNKASAHVLSDSTFSFWSGFLSSTSNTLIVPRGMPLLESHWTTIDRQ